jgi:thiazole synthase
MSSVNDAPAPSVSGDAGDDPFVLAGRAYRSRLIVGTGKYRDFPATREAVERSGAEIVTVAVRRVNITDAGAANLLDHLDPRRYTILPNTAGCHTAEEAVRTCRLARDAGVGSLVKLEVIGDERTLFPDVAATLSAARTLVAEGFQVLPYVTDDPVACKRLEELGCVAVMPLAAPIGSGLGIRNPYNLRIILEHSAVPVIVDAGVGTASDAAVALELGCDAVLMNTAIAGARDPLLMADAMRLGVEAGRKAFRAGRIARKLYATASSPLGDLIE